MYDVYINFYKEYKQLYGDRTAIFLMVGSFYELYDIQNRDGTTECNIKDIVDILGIQLTTKKDLPAGLSGDDKVGLFAGIPDYTIHKWAGRLTSSGWSVIVVDQQKDESGAVKSRQVARVLSPSTHIENLGTADTAYILGLVLTENVSLLAAPSFTAAAFDLSTGRTYTFNGALSGRGDIWYSDELTHFLQVFAPREIIVWWNGSVISIPTQTTLEKTLCIPSHVSIYVRQYQLGLLTSSLIQDEYLRTLYNIKSMLPTREWLSVSAEEQPGLILLLKFIEEHLPSSFQKLEKNERWTPTTAVRLGNSALNQLQIIAPNLRESVLGIFDQCITPIGKRQIRSRILNPIWDISELNTRLQRIAAHIDLPSDRRKSLEINLRAVYDIPRIHRRILCGTIGATDVIQLHTTYLAMKSLSEMDMIYSQYASVSSPTINKLISKLETHFDINKAELSSDDISFLHSHQYPDIDKCEKNISQLREDIDKLRSVVTSAAGISADAISVESKNNVLVFRGSVKAMKSIQVLQEYKQYVHLLKSGGTLEIPSLSTLGYRLGDERVKLRRAVDAVIPVICDKFVADTQSTWRLVEEWIETIDIDRCIASVSELRGFTRPIFAEGENATMKFTNLRHPLIEATMTRTQYVKHNISLGEDERGWLIYGMNASGKSSLMKSAGIAVILAQVGCYVPASEAIITPFRSLFTRILNQDNLWAGLSSFAVEMSEMREILTHADQHTLVLGDELCSGTESASAHALVAAGIDWLSQKKANYIFATHLHGLLNILPPPPTLSLAVYHLRVIYDAVNDRLVYERTLTPGPGNSLYGLEVAKAMHVPVDYYEKALKYRQAFLGEKTITEIKASSWNPNVLRERCELCECPVGLEVHHIRQRKDADTSSRRFNDGDARDDARNLVVVCAKCHDKHHDGEIEIAPLQMTSSGPLRIAANDDENPINVPADVSPKTKIIKIKRKPQWLPEEREIIEKKLREFINVPMKRIVLLLKEDGVTITESALRTIRNGLV